MYIFALNSSMYNFNFGYELACIFPSYLLSSFPSLNTYTPFNCIHTLSTCTYDSLILFEGRLDLREFIIISAVRMKAIDPKLIKYLVNTFRIYDLNSDGYIYHRGTYLMQVFINHKSQFGNITTLQFEISFMSRSIHSIISL